MVFFFSEKKTKFQIWFFFPEKKTKFGGEKKTKKKLSFFFGFFSHMDGPNIQKIKVFMKNKIVKSLVNSNET